MSCAHTDHKCNGPSTPMHQLTGARGRRHFASADRQPQSPNATDTAAAVVEVLLCLARGPRLCSRQPLCVAQRRAVIMKRSRDESDASAAAPPLSHADAQAQHQAQPPSPQPPLASDSEPTKREAVPASSAPSQAPQQLQQSVASKLYQPDVGSQPQRPPPPPPPPHKKRPTKPERVSGTVSHCLARMCVYGKRVLRCLHAHSYARAILSLPMDGCCSGATFRPT